MKEEYPIVPGRGLVTSKAKKVRLGYMNDIGIEITQIPKGSLLSEEIKNNIESEIGSVEIPVGLVGPLLLQNKEEREYVYTVVGTLEGALVASMNRGAKCISMAGGYNAQVIHQKMIRTPMFIFQDLTESVIFKKWIECNFHSIKKIAESYSNHATLESIKTSVIGKSVHLKFIFTTGDASGQNMTTVCTWHSILWIQEHFEKTHDIEIVHCVIEGNGASDKKVSQFSISHGRGIHVVADAYLKEDVIQKVLRTTSKDIVRCFNQSVAMSKIDGMIGYNINIANAIAGIFSATGQDLACIHESACGVLNVEQTDDGLYVSLNLPSLVIGTVGGGTHLRKQREALEIMGCYGSGGINRFAKLIAGFALSLEISTYAAIVSGQFAKAHEKLGRNKPKNWLLKSEINEAFLQIILGDAQIKKVKQTSTIEVDNGILSNLTSRVTKKIVGFIPLEVDLEQENKLMLLKSKPLDKEVIKGLHFMASNIDTELADLLFKYSEFSEYKNSHKKEALLYRKIKELGLNCTPEFYGGLKDEKREIFLFVQELLKPDELQLINTENTPELWTEEFIKNVIKRIGDFHTQITIEKEDENVIQEYTPSQSETLYKKMISILCNEDDIVKSRDLAHQLEGFITDLRTPPPLPKTIIHNDFNPRNIAIRSDGTPCIYDWELAVINFPHRDIVEFLSFILPENVEEEYLINLLTYHYTQHTNGKIAWNDWKEGYIYALKEYLVTRVSFYQIGSIIMKYEFVSRIFTTSLRMLEVLNKQSI